MRLIFSLLFVFISLSYIAQVEDGVWHKSIQPEQLQADFNILVSTLADIHPALYQYTSEVELKIAENAIREKLKSSMSMMEFHVLVRQYIKEIKCGHTMARPASSWYEEEKNNPSRMPLEVFLIDDKVYVKHVYQEGKNVPIGSEILSINGKPISDILEDMYAIQERDGLGLTFRDSKVERIFKTFHHFLYGKKDFYQLEYQFNEEVKSVELVGGAFDNQPSRIAKDSTLYDLKLKSKGAQYFKYGENKTPVLDLNTFSRKDFKKFYKKMFKELAESGSETLVVDLRGNGGGFFPHGALLLKYLMPEDFTFDFYRNQEKPEKNKNLKMPFANKMTKMVFGTIPDSDKTDPKRNYQIRYKIKKKNHFDGLLFVLTDGATFSMGSLVTAKLKDSRKATIIGEETGGAAEGSNAVLTGILLLPASGIRVVVPHYHFSHNIFIYGEKFGYGVPPDSIIKYSIDEMVMKNDKEMADIERILKLLE